MTMDELIEQERAKAKVIAFLRRLLNPEELGHAVTAEVRDCARELLGMPKVETDAAAKAKGVEYHSRDAGFACWTATGLSGYYNTPQEALAAAQQAELNETPDDEAWRKLRGLLPGGVDPNWQPTVEEWK